MSDWLRGSVIYQIYPRSFRDSNGENNFGVPTRQPHGHHGRWIERRYGEQNTGSGDNPEQSTFLAQPNQIVPTLTCRDLILFRRTCCHK